MYIFFTYFSHFWLHRVIFQPPLAGDIFSFFFFENWFQCLSLGPHHKKTWAQQLFNICTPPPTQGGWCWGANPLSPNSSKTAWNIQTPLYRMDTDSLRMVYVNFHKPICHRDFSMTIFY